MQNSKNKNDDILRFKAEIQAQQELIKLAESDREEQRKVKEEIEKARKAKLADGGLSMDEIREELKIDSDTPYILNISDDPSLTGCLVFYLNKGVSKLGTNSSKSAIIIKGLGIFEEHCKIEVESYEVVKITPTGKGRTLVNGNFLDKTRILKSNDRLVFGHGNSWKIIIPKLQTQTAKSEDFSYGEIMNDRLNSDTPEAKNIKAYLDELRERAGESKAKVFANLFSEALDLVDEANEYSKYRYHHLKNKKFKVYFTIEVMVDIMHYEDDEPEIAIRLRFKETGNFIISYFHR